MFEPLARSRFPDWRRWLDLRLAKSDAEVARRPTSPGRRRDQPHHGRYDENLYHHRQEALPEKNRMAERDEPARDHAVVGDDLPNLRLERSRRGHLQGRRSAQALCPDAAKAEEAGGGERSIVHALDTSRDFPCEHGAEDETESPVEPRARHGEKRHERDSVARRRRPRRRPANDSAHRLRGREHVPGNDDECHLEREWDQLPQTASPGIDHLRQARGRERDAGDDHDQGGEEREDEGIGHPSLGPGGQRERHAREQSSFRRAYFVQNASRKPS